MVSVERELSFNTDLLKGPRSFEKRWSLPVVNGVVEKLTGRLIVEYSSWMGEVVFMVAVNSDGKEVFRNDFVVLGGAQMTPPFAKRSLTKDLDLPINTRVGQGTVEVELRVSTAVGSLSGVLRDLELVVK